MRSICLNADLGELPGVVGRQLDRELLSLVTRCNVACGGHAGDAETMSATVAAAMAAGVSIGAHPSYPDRENFGRVAMSMAGPRLEAVLSEQVEELCRIAHQAGTRIAHLKPHGALYNQAAQDKGLAASVARVASGAGIPALMGPPDCALVIAAKDADLQYLVEGFIDRTYQADGTLTPRSMPGAVIETTTLRVAQAMELATHQCVKASNGSVVPLEAVTLCVHGDSAGAIDTLRTIRKALIEAGINIVASKP